jgi:hypothetical protein
MKANIGIPVSTRPNLSSGSPNNFEGPKKAKATVEVKKQTTNYNFLGKALKIIGQRIADER